MILTVPLQPGTLLTNVRYRWIVDGIEGSVLSTGITQPSGSYPVFRFDVVPPAGAEELVAFDNTDATGNWNVAQYKLALLTPSMQGAGVSPDLANVRVEVASYLRRNVSELTVDGVDLFLMVANQARKRAEKLHDFEYSKVSATINLSATGASLGAATIVEGVATAGIKSVIGIERTNSTSGSRYPLDFVKYDIAAERDRRELELLDVYGGDLRYPSDRDILAFRGSVNAAIVQRGQRIYAYPSLSSNDPATVTLYLNAYGWLPNYGSVSVVSQPEDFIVEHGSEYLKWAAICSLNKMFQTFVPRQEGNVTEPTTERDAAFRDLVSWDNYLAIEGYTG